MRIQYYQSKTWEYATLAKPTLLGGVARSLSCVYAAL